MIKLQFLILFIVFIHAVPKFIDFFESQIDGTFEDKCNKYDEISLNTEDKCIERNSFLPKEEYGSKCCFFTLKQDPIISYKSRYGENWKKIVALNNGYDLNISEEEIRKKLKEFATLKSFCRYIIKDLNITSLYIFSKTSIDGIVEYDCGERQKIFNISEFHPTSIEGIVDKQLIDSLFTFTEKDCLKNGAKLSSDEYQICWCEKISLSSETKEKTCIPYRIGTFQERLKKEMNQSRKEYRKIENKCTCENNKSKTTKGSYNSVTGEIKVE